MSYVGISASPASTLNYNAAFPQQNASSGSAVGAQGNANGSQLTLAQVQQLEAGLPRPSNQADAKVNGDMRAILEAQLLPPDRAASVESQVLTELPLDVFGQLNNRAQRDLQDAMQRGNVDLPTLNGRLEQDTQNQLGPNTIAMVDAFVGALPGSGGAPPPQGNTSQWRAPSMYTGGSASGMPGARQGPSSISVSA